MPNDYSARAFVFVLAIAILGGVIPQVLQDGFKKPVTMIAAILAVVLLLASFQWPRLEALLGTRFSSTAASLASDFRVWLVVILLFWIYAMCVTVLLTIQRNSMADAIKKEILPFQNALARWVLPRRLDAQQKLSIIDYLKKFPPNAVKFRVQNNDAEANQYASDLNKAIRDGGWAILGVDYVDNLREGIFISSRLTDATARASQDPRTPHGLELLSTALDQIGVRIDGSGGTGSSGDIKTDEYVIDVGRRRRDADVPPLRWSLP